MPPLLSTTFAASLFLLTPHHAPADILIKDVSREGADELNVSIRSHPSGDAIAIHLQLKTDDDLWKNFSHVELRLHDSARSLISFPLHTTRPTSGTVAVTFTAALAYLPQSTLTIITREAPLTATGFRFQVKDFLAR